MNEAKRPVVAITGASAGIGRATVREFASHGFDVGLIARGQDGLEGARRDVEELGGRALAVSADVADAQAMLDAAQRIESELGEIDVWVNDAMTSVFAPFWEIKPDEYERVTHVTYLGQVNGTRAALACMRPRDRGTIVQVGSALAYRSIPLQSAYCGAKAGVRAFTDSVRVELMHQDSRIRVAEVNLPALNTPQFSWVRSRLPRKAQPVPPIFQPEVAAQAIYWASQHPRREVDLAWPAFFGVIGQKFFPGFMDRYILGAWEKQMIDEPRDPNRPDNLFEPLPGDHGAHGAFDDRSRDTSPLWDLQRNAGVLAAATTAVLGLLGVAALTGLARARR